MRLSKQASNIILIGLIVIFFLIVGLAVFLFWQIPEKITSEEVASEDSTGWKTYRSEEYGFEIEYPKSWHAYNAMEGLVVISTFSRWEYDRYYRTMEIEKLEESYGSIWITFPDKPLEEFFELTKKGIEVFESPGSPLQIEEFYTEEINIIEMKGYRIYYSGKSFMRFEEGEESINIVYLFSAEEKEGIIRFEGSFKGKDKEICEERAKDFDQMISTFRFLE